MSLRLLAASVAVAIVAGAAAPAVAANLVTNAGFELPAVQAGGFQVFGGGSDFIGWHVTGSNRSSAVQILSNTYSEPGIVFDAFAGDGSMDLSGQNNSGPTSGIFQTLSTTAGETYDVSFWVGNAAGGSGGNYTLPSSVNLQIDDGALMTFTNADATLGAVNWRLMTTSFRAAGDQTRISFFNATPVGDAFTGLDNVSVSLAVPEPQSWALMILGFGGAGALLRGRRARARVLVALEGPQWSTV